MKFLKKYKYTNLIALTLVIGIITGLFTAYIYDKNSDIGYHENSSKKHALHEISESKIAYQNHIKSSETKDTIKVKSTINTNKIKGDSHHHEHKSCCDACAKNLPCEGKTNTCLLYTSPSPRDA